MAKFIDKDGGQQEAPIGLDTVAAAQAEKLTVRQYINQEYPTTAGNPETFVQLCASEGIYFGNDENLGIHTQRASNLRSIFEPSAASGGNNADAVPASRILFPPALLAAIDADLPLDRVSPVDVFNQTIAITDTVNKARVERPVIDYKTPNGPDEAQSQRASQNAEPVNMALITASDVARKIPTYTLGITVTDEALDATTLPMLALTLRRQKEVEMFRRAGDAVNAMLTGDVDHGTSALPVTKASAYDSAIVADGKLTQKAWMLWLNHNILQLSIDWVYVDSIETAMAIEGREGRPVVVDDAGKDGRMNTGLDIVYPSMARAVKCFVAPKEWALPPNTIMGIQSSHAIAKIVNSSASYEASTRFAMRRAEAMRFDFAEDFYRLFDDAFSVLSLTA